MQSFFLPAIYLHWHYLKAPKNYFHIVHNLAWFLVHFFSIEILLRTLFSPWRRLGEEYKKGFRPGEFIETFLLNIIMRFTGAIIRLVFVAVGVVSVIGVWIGAVLFFVVWMLMPLVVAGLIIAGLALMIMP